VIGLEVKAIRPV